MLRKGKEKSSKEPAKQISPWLWTGIGIVILQWVLRFGVIAASSAAWAIMVGVFGGLLCGVAIVVWWTFFSGRHWIERWGGAVLMIVTLVLMSFVIDDSISTGMRGMMYPVWAIPLLSLAFVVWAVVSRNLSDKPRRLTMVLTILLACGFWTLVRSDGMTGHIDVLFKWRWIKTSEELILSQDGKESMESLSALKAIKTGFSWPGFRGPNRDGVVRGVRIKTDWSASPPAELWRQPIGPGCSSFAVREAFLYTQEQRGKYEIVSCYNIKNGKPVWKHRDKTRFWDSHAGAGPRSTPTISGDRVYTLGATGILNVLNAYTGAVIWSRKAAKDTDGKHSGWGFTSSPLVVNDVVIIAISGNTVAYDINTGKPRWVGPNGGFGYSSPHLIKIDGVTQVLFMSENGATGFEPGSGKVLWEHLWKGERILQPAITFDSDLLLSAGGMKKGIRRLSVEREPNGWNIKELWTTIDLRPDFNDFVIHKGHVYGYSGPLLGCIDIKTGKRKWKGGRYGGQLILLAEQGLLLIISEKGELILVKADPDKFTKLAQIPAIEGKTWNHPIMAGNVLVVRNTREMAAFRLAKEK